MLFDGKSVSLDGPTGGSAWAYSGCGSHYLVRSNIVVWLEMIAGRRHNEYVKREHKRLMWQSARRKKVGSRIGGMWRRLWQIIERMRRRS